MTVTAKNLIASKQAANVATTEYTAPTSTRTIIDKFTATNTTGGAVTLTVYLVPSGQAASSSNKVLDAFSIAANTFLDLPQMQNHVLEAGDFISVLASAATSLTIRASGREVV